MRTKRHTRLTMVAVAALLLAASPSQAQELAEQWTATWAQAVRYQDGELEIQRWGDADLELHRDGEQVTGTWTVDVNERVQWMVTGTLDGTRLTLTASQHDSDNPQLDMVEEMRWRATLTDSGLEGEMTMVFRGRSRDLRWRPWSAVPAGGG